MSRVQLALRVNDLEESVAFYSGLFGTGPAKRRPGYANFAIADPPLKLVLIQDHGGAATALDHLGIEVESSTEVTDAAARLNAVGLAVFEQGETVCCYARQDKVWVTGPGREPWEVYVVEGDADVFGAGEEPAASAEARAGAVGCCARDGA